MSEIERRCGAFYFAEKQEYSPSLENVSEKRGIILAIVKKPEEKFQAVLESLPESYTDNEFVEKFKDLYEKDWFKVVRRYTEHERKSEKQKKGHPMPKPEKYILNISHKIRNAK